MSSAESNALHILHIAGAIGMIASVFYACAGAPETRRKLMRWSGIATLVVVLAGIRLWQGLYQFNGKWAWVKIGCWLALAAFAGLAYRKREKAALWMVLSLVFAVIALVMVYVRPF
jgi:hypothetical protein